MSEKSLVSQNDIQDIKRKLEKLTEILLKNFERAKSEYM
jgi:hypothetical protein